MSVAVSLTITFIVAHKGFIGAVTLIDNDVIIEID